MALYVSSLTQLLLQSRKERITGNDQATAKESESQEVGGEEVKGETVKAISHEVSSPRDSPVFSSNTTMCKARFCVDDLLSMLRSDVLTDSSRSTLPPSLPPSIPPSLLSSETETPIGSAVTALPIFFKCYLQWI